MPDNRTEETRLAREPPPDSDSEALADFPIDEPQTEQVERGMLMDRRRVAIYLLTVIVIVVGLYFVLPKGITIC